jgi:sugar phosphate isomerase/epimerase
MRKFGFKSFSTNIKTAPNLIRECAEFARSKDDIFIELTALAETSADDWNKIKEQIGNVEVRIHASYIGFDTGNRELEQENKKILAYAQRAADIFNAKTIVTHTGYGHGEKYLAETARQFRLFNDERVVVENLPYFDNNGDLMHGNTAAEIKCIMDESGCGFCCDFSHAICAALNLNKDVEMQLQEFFALKPTVYHMCDGDITKAKDEHLHFGKGNYPLKHFLNDLTDENAYITMETGKGVEQHCDYRIEDYNYLKNCL